MSQVSQTPGGVPALAAAQLSVGETFSERARIMGGRTAIRDDARAMSYAELEARSNRLAHALAAAGVGRGDRVAALSENRLEYVELMLACAKIGAILACQNWRQAAEEMRWCLELVDPALVFVSPRYADTLAGLGLEGLRAVIFGEEAEAFAAGAPESPPAQGAEPEDGLLILYTSGTTGLPKAAVISHRAMLARSTIMLSDGVLMPGRMFVAWSPMFHMAATDSLLGVLMTGGVVHVMAELDMDRLAELAASEVIGHLMLMPGMIDRFVEAMRRAGPVREVGMVGVMADLVPRAQIAAVAELLDAPYRNTFGSTETGSAPASRGVIRPGEMPERFSKTQSSFCRLRLVDDEDNDVPDGTPGEAAFRGPSLFSGYWNAPEANAEAFRGGWYHMGDMLVRNPDGTLDFVDRKKYLIKSGGENIYPAEIERVLLASPKVAEAVVVRRKDPDWGEVPAAFVVPAEPGLDAAEVMALLEGRIARYKRPKSVTLISETELTRNSTGKVMRTPLEERARADAPADA
ncbi:MAG: class I adenylate-forming enzyme family protein [Pseudomonadota bacterium]